MSFEDYQDDPQEEEDNYTGPEENKDRFGLGPTPLSPSLEDSRSEEKALDYKLHGLSDTVADSIRHSRDSYISNISELVGVKEPWAEKSVAESRDYLARLKEDPERFYRWKLDDLESYLVKQIESGEPIIRELEEAIAETRRIVEAFD